VFPSARSSRRGLPLAVILQALIAAGDGLAMVALASRVYQSSHASWAVASVFLAVTVPITALAPVAGTLLDRFPVRPVLIAASVAQTVVALTLTRFTSTGATLGLSIGFGLCAAVLQPGLGVIVPQLAGRSGVIRANGYLQAATWGGFTVGPLLAGGLTAAGGTGLALGAVAAMYALGAAGLGALQLGPPPAYLGQVAEAAASQHGARQFSAGLRFLRADREAGLLVVVVSVMVTFANMASVAEVAFAEGVLKAGPTGYSVLVAAWTAGMLAGTLAGGRLPRRRLVLAVLLGSLVTGVGVALAAGALTLWQAAAAYGIGGVANGMEVVATRSFLNHRAPAAISGRVFALYSGLLFGATSLGMAVAGGLLAPLDPRLVLLIAGGGGIVATVFGGLRYRRLTPPQPTVLADPVLADPGLADTGLADPGLADPGLADPGLADTALSGLGPDDAEDPLGPVTADALTTQVAGVERPGEQADGQAGIEAARQAAVSHPAD
jgi:MFS family permease